MEVIVEPAKYLRGEITVPGDKSISHRAAMIGVLAEGTTEIHGFLHGADCLSTISCLEKMGARYSHNQDGSLTVEGLGLRGFKEPEDILDAGNSGTTMRLLLGILAGQNFHSIITGDASLCRRPMGRVVKPLRRMGANISGRQGGNYAPLAVQGSNLQALEYNSPVASAQVKSAILLAGLYADGKTSITEPTKSRDHTERMLKSFGVPVREEGTWVEVTGFPRLEGQKVVVPGDISSAAFFLVAGLVVKGSEINITGVGVNPTRDGIVQVLQEMGGHISIENRRQVNGEPVADITVRSSDLRGVTVGGEIIPRLIDELPVLAVAACFATGTTIIKDAAELKVKETDRIKAVVQQLGKMGARITERPDGMEINGGPALQGAHVTSMGDHRMAMSLTIAALAARGRTIIDQAEAVSVSYPDFFTEVNRLRK